MSLFEEYGLQRIGDDPSRKGYEIIRHNPSGKTYASIKGTPEEKVFQDIQDYEAPGFGTLLGSAWKQTLSDMDSALASKLDTRVREAQAEGKQPWEPVHLFGPLSLPIQQAENLKQEVQQRAKDRRDEVAGDLLWSESVNTIYDLDDVSSYMLQLGVGGLPYLATFAGGSATPLGPIGGALL